MWSKPLQYYRTAPTPRDYPMSSARTQESQLRYHTRNAKEEIKGSKKNTGGSIAIAQQGEREE